MKLNYMVVATSLVCSSAAIAQSSVTLYGVVDINVEYANHVGVVPTAANQFNRGPSNDVIRLNSGGYSGSRWGIRGTESLGSGLNAVFVLENGFALDNGTLQQSGRMFGRQAFVGLQKEGMGQFSMGRQYNSMFDAMANFVPVAYAAQYEPGVLMTGPNFRQDNTVKYSGQFGAVSAVAHWSFGTGVALPQTVGVATPIGGNGEVPGQFRRDTAYGAGVTYQAADLGVSVAYDQWNPTIGTSSGTLKKAAVGSSYAFGPVKIMGGYRWAQSKNTAGQLIQRDDFYWVGANYRLTPSIGLTLEYNYDNVKSLFGDTHVANPWQIAFVANYSFSKRTDLYLSTAYAKNAGLMMESLATAYANSLSLGNSYTLGNGQNNMIGVATGIRHKF